MTNRPIRDRLQHAIRAAFVERPNRFVVLCDAGRAGRIEAFLPNPGRLWELLLPRVALYVTPSDNPGRRTKYTVLAVERDGAPVFLHTHWNNEVARSLLEKRRIPGLEGATVVRAEVPVGRSRFDFLLEEKGRDLYLEVKSCTLFGEGVAMFPDAVTERGRRHLLELADLAAQGTRTAVLFLVHTPTARWFMPDYHTDPAFADTLFEVRGRVRILPVAVAWTRQLRLKGAPRLLDIPWTHVKREAKDRGAYLLVLRLERPVEIDVGGLGSCRFDEGYYVYTGSAMGGLSARIARHARARKTRRWHIDYLRPHASDFTALAIRSSRREEHALAAAVGEILAPGPRGFGAGDSPLPTHLFHSAQNPLERGDFHAVLQRFRMRPPD